MSPELEDRVLRAVHERDVVDVELLAHDIARDDAAQAYLVSLVATLSAVSPTSRAVARAETLLEHGLVIAAEHEDHEVVERAATKTRTRE